MPDWRRYVRDNLSDLAVGPQRENEIVAELALQLEQGGNVEFSQARFLGDDLNQLVANGLLSLNHTSDGKNGIYGITRNASRLIEAIDGK